MREVSLVICKGRSVVLKLIAASAAVCCTSSSSGEPDITFGLLSFENNCEIRKLCKTFCAGMHTRERTLSLYGHTLTFSE